MTRSGEIGSCPRSPPLPISPPTGVLAGDTEDLLHQLGKLHLPLRDRSDVDVARRFGTDFGGNDVGKSQDFRMLPDRLPAALSSPWQKLGSVKNGGWKA